MECCGSSESVHNGGRELPEAYGPWQSVYARFAKWRDDGTLEKVFRALSADPDKGYRRIRNDLARYYGAPVNDKQALRTCRSLGVRSTIKYARHSCTRRASDPQYLAENVLNRQFYADKPNEK